jgi:hypothetical protein
MCYPLYMSTTLQPAGQAMQMGFDFRPVGAPAPPARAPFWSHLDGADLGQASLQARRGTEIAALLGARQITGGWVGDWDVRLTVDGTSGESAKLQRDRGDALMTAADAIHSYCQAVLRHPAGRPRVDLQAARELVRWVKDLDLL